MKLISSIKYKVDCHGNFNEVERTETNVLLRPKNADISDENTTAE